MEHSEHEILEVLDRAIHSIESMAKIDEIVARVRTKLADHPDDVLAWEVIPLGVYTRPLPAAIRSSWVFVLRAGATTGAERHPNSHQRMMSYSGSGDFQTRPGDEWLSHFLVSDPRAPISKRWISIPPNVWHQGVVSEMDWAVVSFQTAEAHELIEERPIADAGDAYRRRTYHDEH